MVKLISLEFLILTILFFLNIALMIIKDKQTVFISFIIAIFTWAMGAFYLIDYLDILNQDIGIEGIYCCLVIVIAVILFFEKGSEKW